MSSHHFVKEGQEPALFIMDAISIPAVMSLLEWSPRVLVTMRALPEVLAWGIKIDGIISDSAVQGLQPDQLTDGQSHVDLVVVDRDRSEVATALSFLIDAGETSVNIITNIAIEHSAIGMEYSDRIRVSVLDDQWRWVVAPKGRFEKWLPADSRIQIRCTQNTKLLHTENLRETPSGFEVITTGIFRIHHKSSFWVGEAL